MVTDFFSLLVCVCVPVRVVFFRQTRAVTNALRLIFVYLISEKADFSIIMPYDNQE